MKWTWKRSSILHTLQVYTKLYFFLCNEVLITIRFQIFIFNSSLILVTFKCSPLEEYNNCVIFLTDSFVDCSDARVCFRSGNAVFPGRSGVVAPSARVLDRRRVTRSRIATRDPGASGSASAGPRTFLSLTICRQNPGLAAAPSWRPSPSSR